MFFLSHFEKHGSCQKEPFLSPVAIYCSRTHDVWPTRARSITLASDVRVIHFISLHLIMHNMPRCVGSSEKTVRWNSSNDAEFRKLVGRGIIDIKDITPHFIESIRESSERWKTRSATNFRSNYRRVTNTLRLERDLVGARTLGGESCVACFSFSGIFY